MDTQQNIQPSTNIPNNDNTLQTQNMVIGLLVILLVLSFLGINILLVVGNFFQAVINLFGPLLYKILGVFGYTAGSVLNKTANVVSDTTKVGVDIADGTVQSVGNLLIKSSGAVVDPNAKRLLDDAVNTPIRLQLPTLPPVKILVPVPAPGCSPGSSNSAMSFNSLLNNPVTRFLMYDPSKTTAPMTTSPMTTMPMTTAPMTTMPMTAKPMTTAPMTTMPMTAAPMTAAPTATMPMTTPASVSPTESASKIQNPISSNKISWCFTGEYQGKRGCIDVEDQSKCLSGQVFPSQQACLATTTSSDPLISRPIVPTISTSIPNYGNGTMMMNGLPLSPVPQFAPIIEQLQTINSPAGPIMTNAPFLPFVPPQMNPNVIQADGAPIVNGPINYFYTYSDKLGTEKTI